MSISRLKRRKISAARVLPSAWICACVTLRITASAAAHTNETVSENRTVTTSVSTRPRSSNPSLAAKDPYAASGAPWRAREFLLLLLEELGHGPRAFDRELLHLAVRGAGEGVQELGHAVELARLEQRLEVVVRQAHVGRHLG